MQSVLIEDAGALSTSGTHLALSGCARHRFIIDERYRWSVWAAPKTADGQFDHDTALTGADLIAFVNGKLFPYLQGFRERATGPDTIEYKIGEIFGEIRNKFASGYSLRDALELIDGLSFRSQAEKHELSHLYEAKIRNMSNAGRNGGEYLDKQAKGSIMAGLNMGIVKSLPVRLPSLEEQAEIVCSIEELKSQVSTIESIYERKLSALAELKQSLLQKAFSGELTVGKEASDALRMAEEVA